MVPEFFLETAVKGAAKLLPPVMDSPEASAMILAICLQESKLEFRRQVGGPARGFFQFERGGGVTGIFNHPASSTHIKMVCAAVNVTPTIAGIYDALDQNDILAASAARLLLWTLPQALPLRGDAEGGWQQYIQAWRPGRPRRETWDAHFNHAWAVVEDARRNEMLSADMVAVKNAAVMFIAGYEQLQGSVKAMVAHQSPTAVA